MSLRQNPHVIPSSSIIPAQPNESKRDRKRRETINKVELLHEESWKTRDERFQQLYKELHAESKGVNVRPPTSSKYAFRLYPKTVERDALLESAEINYQYKSDQAKRLYEDERQSIEAQYNDAKEQAKQRLIAYIEDRRRRLREEKEGGDVVTENLLDSHLKRPSRRPFRGRSAFSISAAPTPYGNAPSGLILPSSVELPNGIKGEDILAQSYLVQSLASIKTEDIIIPNSNSLILVPPPLGPTFAATTGKRGPRGKMDANGDGKGDSGIAAAPGTLTALAIASGQQQPAQPKPTGRGAGAQGQWVLGKSLAEMKKMESLSLTEAEGDLARMNGTVGRGRRNRGD